MKGFFDTIPTELDESARVDGATPAQIFWGVVLPLAAPVLAVVGLISFICTLNEFVIASALLQTNDHFTLAVGHAAASSTSSTRQHWGPFAAGVAARGDPGRRSLPVVPAAVHRRRAHRRARSRDERDGVEARGRCSPSRITTARSLRRSSGRTSSAARRSCACACRTGRRSTRSSLRYVDDGEPRTVEAVVDERDGRRDVVARDVPGRATRSSRYRWLLSGGDAGYAWLNGRGVVAHDVPDADDFVLAARSRRAGLAPRARSSTRSSPTASPRAGAGAEAPDVGGAPRVGRAADGPRAEHAARVVRRRPARGSSSISTTSRSSARTSST